MGDFPRLDLCGESDGHSAFCVALACRQRDSSCRLSWQDYVCKVGRLACWYLWRLLRLPLNREHLRERVVQVGEGAVGRAFLERVEVRSGFAFCGTALAWHHHQLAHQLALT